MRLPAALTCAAQGWTLFPLERGPFWAALCAVYGLTTVLIFRGMEGPDRRLWLWAGMVLLALTLGKVFDLQSLLTGTARCFTMQSGVYDRRRPFQVAMIGLLILLGVAATALALHHRHGNALLICGLALLLTFLAIRALSFHPVDALLALRPAGLPLNRLIEAAALLPILVAALRR